LTFIYNGINIPCK